MTARRPAWSIFACALCVSSLAIAQHGQTVPIHAEALTYDKDGVVQGCGVRLTGGEPAAGGASSWFDVSFSVFRRGIGLAQSIAYELRPSGYDGESRPARVPVQSTWVKAAEGSARLGENTERRDSLIYTLLLEDVLSLFEALASGQPLVLGIKRWGQLVDSVHTGAPVLTSDSRERVSACLERLVLE